jgi:dienelactone hydrolase
MVEAMSSYDPFARGPHPVGVRTFEWTDSARSRHLPTEVWYPATEACRGQDTDEATQDRYDIVVGLPQGSQQAVRDAEASPGRHPLVMFSHGFGGHRRQTTHLCTHLASHGYVVAACDHTGNTILDMAMLTMQIMSGGELPDAAAMITEFIEARPLDAIHTIDRMLDGEMAALVDPERIGMTGHSFGGWTTICATARDHRIRAAMPLAPAGGRNPIADADPLRASVDFDWGREVPTLYLVADRDTLLPLDGMQELLARTPSVNKRMVVLSNADHMHFCDDVEMTHEMFRTMPPPGPLAEIAKAVPPASEFCPGEHAYIYLRGLGLAHMDAHVKGHEAAAALLAGDIKALLAERGVAVETA